MLNLSGTGFGSPQGGNWQAGPGRQRAPGRGASDPFAGADLSKFGQGPTDWRGMLAQATNQDFVNGPRGAGGGGGGPGQGQGGQMPPGYGRQPHQRTPGAMTTGRSGSNFPGAPNVPGQNGLFPSIGSGPYGIRDQAPGLLGHDLERQQGAFDAAFQGQQDALGQAAQMFGGLAGQLTSIGVSGLEEIRGMNQQNLDAFGANRDATMGAAKDRYLGNQASNVAATSGRIASEKNRIMSDPSMSPAQKSAMVQELSFGIGQQGYGAAQQSFGEYQALNTGLQAQFANQETALRSQNTGFVGQGYDRLGQLAATGGQAGAAGMAQIGQLMGAMPQQLVSLFGGLTNLESFRQGTPWQQSYNINVPGSGAYGGTISGMPGQSIRGGTTGVGGGFGFHNAIRPDQPGRP